MKIGKPTHFRPTNKNVTSCGVVGASYMAYDARDCDCLRCKQTKAYQVYMGYIDSDDKWPKLHPQSGDI